MLQVQQYLQNHSLKQLENEFGVEHKFHATLPILLLDYNQIESEKKGKKKDPIVCECRGLVLENETWNLVSKGFNRFFNLAEYPDDFDWGGPIECTAKEDGSLIKISWYKDQWVISTRFSFAEGQVNNSGFTWRDLVLQHVDLNKLNKEFTYIGELCGPHNRVVRDYQPSFFLLSIFKKDEEFPYWAWTYEANRVGLRFVESFSVTSKTDVDNLLDEIGIKYPDFEGVVLKDCHGTRIKVKRNQYVLLHNMVANGNIATPKHLVPILLSGERDEVLSQFKWLVPYAQEYQKKINDAWKEIDNTWFCYKTEKSRKQFAIGVTKSTRFSWPLFQAYISGKEPKEFFTVNYILKNVFGV